MKKKLSKILGIGLSIALVTSLLVAAIPATALSTPVVTFAYGENVISRTNADYVIEFTVGKQLTGNSTYQDAIVLTFPEGYIISATAAIAATIVAGPGWVDPGTGLAWAATPPDLTGGTWTSNSTLRTITYTMQGDDTPKVYIGSSAAVRIEITDGVKNPATPGDYQLSVTNWDGKNLLAEEGPTASAVYPIVEPMIDPLAGIVLGYNSAGILMKQSHTIQDCIDAAGVGGTVEIGPGSYDQDVNANQPGQTIVGTGEPGTVIITNVNLALGGSGLFNISAGESVPNSKVGVTVDGITFKPNAIVPAPNLITIEDSATYATIKNCDITSGSASAITIAANATAMNSHTISNCTITATSTKTNQTAIIANEAVTVADSTITVGAKGTAITTSSGGAYPNPTTTIKGDTTISGSSGKGIVVTGGVVSIDGITLQSLTTALTLSGTPTVTMANSVVDGCGSSTAGTGDAIEAASGTVRMYNNTIQNSAALNYAMDLGGTLDIEAHFNNILNNTKAIKAAGTANCSHNWWGSADGPAFGVNSGALLVTKPYLGNSVTTAALAVGRSSLDATATVGMDVAVLTGTGTAGTAQILGVAKYSANPELTPPTIKGTGSVVGYYDLYAAGVGSGNIVQVKFYVPVTPYTKVYYAGGISGRWVDAGGGVNTASGYAYLNIGGIDSGLTVSDLGGTVFAVVEDKTTTAGPSIGSGVGSPLIGSYDVSTEPMFTWGAVPGSIRYEIALSEDPTFTIIEWSYNVDQTFYKVDEPLRYDTTYYWRVRGVLGEPYQEGGQWLTPATPWTTGIFTTASEPEPPAEPIVVQPTKPEVNVEIPPTKITIEPAEQAIPNYMLWIIVAVGAILVIALIVLIVRTRRVV